MDTAAIVRAYMKIREARSALKKDFDAADTDLKGKQAKLEGALLKFLNDSSMKSVKTDAGTFYKQEEIRPGGSDWAAFYDWVKENDAFDALERRIKKGFIVEYMEEHEGELPPGVSVYREYVVRVRKPT